VKSRRDKESNERGKIGYSRVSEQLMYRSDDPLEWDVGLIFYI